MPEFGNLQIINDAKFRRDCQCTYSILTLNSHVSLYCTLQLRADIAEIKILADQAKREKIKDILAIELRRCETNLEGLLKKEDAAQKDPSTALAPTLETPVIRTYDVTVKNYCEYYVYPWKFQIIPKVCSFFQLGINLKNL